MLEPTVVMLQSQSPRPRLTWSAKLLYGVGDMVHAVKMVTFGLFVLFFYTSVVGLPALWVGFAGALGLVWDAAIDPFIGYVSDRRDLGLGRRHSFMILGTGVMGISLWALFSPPRGLPILPTFLWLLITSLLARSSTSLFLTPYYALGAELSTDYYERTSISGVRGAMILLGTMLTAGLSFIVFFPNNGHGPDPKLQYEHYPAMGFSFGVGMMVVAVVAIVGTWRWRPFLTQVNQATSHLALGDFLRSSFAALRHRTFLILFASSSLFSLGVVINTNLSLYFLTYYLQISQSATLSGLQFSFYAGSLIGVLVWLNVSRYVEKRWLCGGAMVMSALAAGAAPLVFGTGHIFGIGSSLALVGGYSITGFFGSILWVLPLSMLADIVDQDELGTGYRREGTFFGLFFFGQQMGAGLSLLISGTLLDWFVRIVPGQSLQSAQTIVRIGLLFGLVPGLLLALAGGLILCYRLDAAAVQDIQRQLRHVHSV